MTFILNLITSPSGLSPSLKRRLDHLFEELDKLAKDLKEEEARRKRRRICYDEDL